MTEYESRLRRKINESRTKVANLLLDCYSQFEIDLAGGYKGKLKGKVRKQAEQKFYSEVLKDITSEIKKVSPFDEQLNMEDYTNIILILIGVMFILFGYANKRNKDKQSRTKKPFKNIAEWKTITLQKRLTK